MKLAQPLFPGITPVVRVGMYPDWLLPPKQRPSKETFLYVSCAMQIKSQRKDTSLVCFCSRPPRSCWLRCRVRRDVDLVAVRWPTEVVLLVSTAGDSCMSTASVTTDAGKLAAANRTVGRASGRVVAGWTGGGLMTATTQGSPVGSPVSCFQNPCVTSSRKALSVYPWY